MLIMTRPHMVVIFHPRCVQIKVIFTYWLLTYLRTYLPTCLITYLPTYSLISGFQLETRTIQTSSRLTKDYLELPI